MSHVIGVCDQDRCDVRQVSMLTPYSFELTISTVSNWYSDHRSLQSPQKDFIRSWSRLVNPGDDDTNMKNQSIQYNAGKRFLDYSNTSVIRDRYHTS